MNKRKSDCHLFLLLRKIIGTSISALFTLKYWTVVSFIFKGYGEFRNSLVNFRTVNDLF